jgi:hypothetical protein
MQQQEESALKKVPRWREDRVEKEVFTGTRLQLSKTKLLSIVNAQSPAKPFTGLC